MKSLLVFALLCLTLLQAAARPAWPGLRQATMADGSCVTYRLVGDEHGHAYLTLDGRAIEPVLTEAPTAFTLSPDIRWRYCEPAQAQRISVVDDPDKQSALTPSQAQRLNTFPTIGVVRGLVLLVEFEDCQFQPGHDRDLFQRQLNEPGYSLNGAHGSARDYFIAQSMGQFTPEFDVVGPVRLPHPESYYGENLLGQDARPGQMVVDACQLAHDQLDTDFSQYDFDGDGRVDFVFCIFAGYGENYGASPNTIWPHMSNLRSQWLYFDLDGHSIDLYACSCELRYDHGTQLDGIGALCHEFGHVLGLADIYNGLNQHDVQLGQWDVMDVGSYNDESRLPPAYTAFERYQLGWLDFIDLTVPADEVIVPELTQSNVAYRITTPSNPDEFFTIENRQQVGWDAAQGGRGLMIIHVDYDATVWQSNMVNATTHPHYDLVEADGTPGKTYETDLFPIAGHDALTDYTTPSARNWQGVPTDGAVTHITQRADGTISFSFRCDRLDRPVLLPAQDVTDSSFVASWLPVADAVGYQLDLAELIPDSLNDLLLGEDFASLTLGSYPNSNATDISAQIADSLRTPGWEGTELYACGGMVRVGSAGHSGELLTPTLRTTDDTTITLSLTACAYPGRRISCSISLLDANGEERQRETLLLDRNLTTELIVFGHCPADARLRISTANDRLFVDDLRIARGEVDEATIATLGPHSWQFVTTDTEILINAETLNAESTQTALNTNLSSLNSKNTYRLTVTALHAEPLRNSLPSDELLITLPSPSAIEAIHPDSPRSPRLRYDLMGRPVKPGQAIPFGPVQILF